jgi:proton-dependent oligopeptide transporter, POT family
MSNNSHSLAIIPISASKMLERLGYYGMRSILVLYMVHELNISRISTATTYGLFMMVVGILPLLGGLIGDLVLNPRITALVGGCIQALGCFLLAGPTTIALYIGLFFIALGAGLYNPNIISTLHNAYKNKSNKLDAAMLIFYCCINIGAFLAPLLIGSVQDAIGYKAGFIVAGMFILLSSLMLIFFKGFFKAFPKTANIYVAEEKKTTVVPLRITIAIISVLCLPFFWSIYQLMTEPIYNRIDEIQHSFPNFLTQFYGVPVITTIIIGAILATIYSFVKASSFLKVFIGFLIYMAACIIICTYSQSEINNSFLFFILFGMFLQGIAELFIAPIALSIICQYGSTKFNSTSIGVYMAISSLSSYTASFLITHLTDSNTIIHLLCCIIPSTIFAVIFMVFYVLSKMNKSDE